MRYCIFLTEHIICELAYILLSFFLLLEDFDARARLLQNPENAGNVNVIYL